MTQINKQLFDSLIHNQIAVGRYSDKQVQDIVSLLNSADAEILAKITARGEDGKFTSYRLKMLLKDIKETVDAAYWDMEKKLHTEMGGFAIHSAEVAGSLLSSQLPVDFSIVGLSDKQLLAIIDNTPIKIGKDGADLFADIFKKLADNKVDDIRKAIRLGMVEGETVDQMTRRLKGTKAAQYKDGLLEGGRRDMANLVRTTTNFIGNQSALATYRANSEVLKGFIDVATLDSRACFFCISKSGKVFPLEGQGPTWHVGCRCFTAPLVKSWAELGIDAKELPVGMRSTSSGLVKADISFQDWLTEQPVKTQTELLGVSRQKLFASGSLKLDKLVDASGKTYTLDQLKSLNS